MKIKKQDEFNEVCDALEKKSAEIDLLDDSCLELIEKRSDLFSEIILENKLLRGNWVLYVNEIPSAILTTDKLKKENDLRDLVKIGPSLKDRKRMHIKTAENFDMTLIGSNTYWRVEICLLYVNDFDELFKFFKEQGIKLQYDIFDFRISAIKKKLRFLEKLEE